MLKFKSLSDEVQTVRDFEVVEYMGNMDGEHHSILSRGPVCHSRTRRWIGPSDKKELKDVYQECRDAQLNLTIRVNKYLEKAKLPPLQLEGDGDWDGVKFQVDRACVVLEKSLKTNKRKPGFASALRRGYDTLCRNAGAGKALLSIIPDDLMIASAISGGLNIVFTALESHAIYEESVFKALEGLPEILDTNERYSDIAMNDPEIHRRTARLYARVCEALEYILRWMMDNVIVSGAKQLFQPKRYAKDLNDKMAEVRLAAQGLRQWADTVLLESQKDLINLNSGMYKQQTHVSHQVEDLNHKVDQLSSKLDRVNRLEMFIPITFNNIQLVLDDEWFRAYQNRGAGKHNQEHQIAPVVIATSTDDVLNGLMYDSDLVPKDVDDVLRQGRAPLHKKHQPARVLAIQENPRLQAWLSLDDSCILLVNCNAASHLDLSISFVSAGIVHALMEQASQPRESVEIIPLAYFCGQHQDFSHDEAASPSELAMSLLLQLVDQHRDFGAADLRRCLEETDPNSIESIIRSLGRLLDRLTSKTIVYLVVDGVEHFARPDLRRAQFQDVLVLLADVFRQEREIALKILFTCVQKGVFLERLDLLSDDEIVNIPKSPPPISVWRRENTH